MPRLSVAAIVVTLLAVSACRESPPVTAPSPPSPITDTFSSTLALHGASSRTFGVAAGGTVHITLTSVGPPSVPIGLGLGVPSGASACALAVSLTTEGAGSPQISEAVDPGEYCVQVYDVGHVADSIHFSLTIERP